MKVISYKYLSSAIVAIVFICYSLAGVTSENNLYISFGLFFLWIFTSLLSNITSFVGMLKNKKYLYFIFYILYLIVSSLINADLISTLKIIGETFVLFSPMFVFSYYFQAKQIHVIKKITIISGIFYLLIAFYALTYYSTNPNAARLLASNRFALNTIAIGGGYGLAYGSTLLAVYFFDIWRCNLLVKKAKRFMLLLIIIILSLLVIKTRSTITIIFMFFGFAASIILFPQKNNFTNSKINNSIPMRRLVLLSVLLLGSIIAPFYSKETGLEIISYFSNSENIVFKRIQEVGFALSYGETDEGTMGLRFTLIQQSLSAFFNNPIFGQGWIYGNSFMLSRDYIGNHSEWADTLGRIGLLGGIPFFLIFKNSIKEDRRRIGKYLPPTYILVFFFLGLFNPFQTFQSMFILFFLIPSIGLFIKGKHNSNLFNNKFQIS